MRATRGVILAAFLLGLAPRPGLADGARLRAELGFGGYVVPGRWMPLVVTVSGAVESARVEVIHEEEGPAGKAVESLPCPPPGGGNRVEYPLFAAATGSAVLVRLVAGDQILAKQHLRTDVKVFPGHLVLAVGLPAVTQQALGQILLPAEPVLAVERGLAELPNIPLGYDGVSGLVMADPGPVLNPAQTKSIRAWLAGGGRLVICAARPGAEGLAASFLPADRPAVAGTQEVPLGFGRLVLVDNQPSELSLAEWRRFLPLPPYAQALRITASRFFAGRDSLRAQIPSLARGYLWLLGGWAAASLGLCLLARRKGLVLLLVLTVIATSAAVPAGSWYMRTWRRGAVVRTRAIILPQGGGLLVNTGIELARAGRWRMTGTQASPWGVTIDLQGEGQGRLAPRSKPPLIWRHHVPTPSHVARLTGSTGLSLAGWLPPLPGPGGLPPTSREQVLWDGKSWQPGRRGGRMGMEQCPAWLRGESDWLAALAALAPGSQWLIGYGSLPGLTLAIQGGAENEAYWAKPLYVGGGS